MSLRKRRDTSPLKVGGESMIQLLRGVNMETLEQIAEDLRPETFANVDLIRVIDRVMECRKQVRLLEEGDTVSMEMED